MSYVFLSYICTPVYECKTEGRNGWARLVKSFTYLFFFNVDLIYKYFSIILSLYQFLWNQLETSVFRIELWLISKGGRIHDFSTKASFLM